MTFAGCSGRPLPLGTFIGHRNDPGQPGADPVVVAQLNRVILKIDADGKANLEDGGLPWEGHVTRSGDRIDFEVDAINGRGIASQPGELARRIEFRVLSPDRLSFGGVSLERSTGH